MVPGYREVRQLGAGRTGRVFLATYQATGAYVAIKYLNATLRRDPEFMERFRRETPSLVEIDDPNVTRLHEYVETASRAAVVMELVDGLSLRALLAEHGRASPEAALAVLKGTLLGLAAAHERGVWHRDCTPENVLVQADGTSKLTDFGLAVHVAEPGVPAGSPPYMAPELWTTGAAGVPADLYAATCTMFECVTGRPPYRGGARRVGPEPDLAALRDRHLVEPVPVEVVPDALRALLRRGLAKDPAGRPRSAREYAGELEEAALAGYGLEWEKRGRRHLSELATLLALRFPLANPTSEAAPSLARDMMTRVGRVPRLPPHLWIAGGAVATMAIALLVSGGRLPPGPGTFLSPPDKSPYELGGEPLESPRTRKPSTPRPTGSTPPTNMSATRPATPPPVPTTVPTAVPTNTAAAPTPPSSRGTPPPAPTSGPAPTPVVTAATIVTWTGSAGAVRVATAGPGPVRLSLSYTRRDGDGPAREVHSEKKTLTGKTSYTVAVLRDPGDVACGKRAHFGLLVLTDRAAANGPQVSEVAVDGPACGEPSTAPSSSSTTTTPVLPSPSPDAARLPTASSTTAPPAEPTTRADPTGPPPDGNPPEEPGAES